MRRGLLKALVLIAALAAAGSGRAEVPRYFHAIHCDPHFASELDWQALVALVAAADARGIRLSIQFNPAWSGVVGSAPARPVAIEDWLSGGHEVGGHHHVFTHPGAWDGYSSEAAALAAPGYLGDMQDWLAALNSMLPASVEVSSVSSKDYDFPSGVDFQTGGSDSTPSPFDAASVPTLKTLQGAPVWNLKHGALIAGGSWQTAQMKASFNATSAEQVFGVAFHPQDYYPGNRSNVDEWFDFLVAADPDHDRSWTPGALLEAHRESLQVPLPSASTGMLVLVSSLLLGASRRALR